MSIFNIPKKEIESILPLLQEGAKNRLGTEGICTLAELDPDESFAGCIQFAVEEENDTPVGRLLYLYVLPQKREQGVGEQLLMAMEDSLFKRGIRKAVVLLPSDQSELGEYLEEYGFSMTENRRACFLRLSSIREEKEIDEELSRRIVSLQELGGTGARRIYSLYKDITTWNTEGLDLTQSCALAETEPEAMLLVRNENGYPALTFFAPNNEDGWESKRALILWMAERILKHRISLEKSGKARRSVFMHSEKDWEGFRDYIEENGHEKHSYYQNIYEIKRKGMQVGGKKGKK